MQLLVWSVPNSFLWRVYIPFFHRRSARGRHSSHIKMLQLLCKRIFFCYLSSYPLLDLSLTLPGFDVCRVFLADRCQAGGTTIWQNYTYFNIILTLLLFLLFVGFVHLRSLIYQNHELSEQEHPVTDVFALHYAIKYSGVLRVGPPSDAAT